MIAPMSIGFDIYILYTKDEVIFKEANIITTTTPDQNLLDVVRRILVV